MSIKIISGAQDGVDIAALRAAKRAGFETGGTMPFGFQTVSGVKPEYNAMYGVVQNGTKNYTRRTIDNVQNSDITFLLAAYLNSPGSKCTKGACVNNGKLCLSAAIGPGQQYDLTDPEKRAELLEKVVRRMLDPQYSTFNIAGNRDKALEPIMESFLFDVFSRVKAERGIK
jgi:hypothetical protein